MSEMETVYDKLREVARNQTTICYEEVGSLVGLQMDNPAHRNELAELLGEISTREHQAGQPMLSAVVVHKDNATPGQGFFTLARELGKYVGPDDVFHARELEAVYEAHKCL